MNAPERQRAIVLFAHGSRDPLWRAPMDAVVARIALQSPQTPVRCAFLELCAPDLGTAAGELAGAGAEEIVVVPMFLGVGKHAREDLPQLIAQLRQIYPHVRFLLQSAVGEDPRLLDTLAAIALDEDAT